MNTQRPASTASIADVFGTGCIDEILPFLPPAISDLMENAPQNIGVSKETAVAAGLAELSAAMGGSHRLQCGGRFNFSAQLNLLMVTENGASVDWLSYIGQPMIESAIHALRSRDDVGASVACKQYLHSHKQVASKNTTHLRNTDPELLANYTKARVACRPRSICWGNSRVAQITEALCDSYDRTVCICNGAVDPLVEWLKQSKSDGEEMLRLLLHSWTLKPLLAGSSGAILPATLQMVVGTGADAARRWLRESRKWLDLQPVPILMFQQRGSPHWLNRNAAGVKSMFHLLLEHCDKNRQNTFSPTLWRLDGEAEASFVTFHQDFQQRAELLPAHEQGEVKWIVDACFRLCLLIAVAEVAFRAKSSSASNDGSATVKPIRLAVAQCATAITHWFAAHHLKTLRWLRQESPECQTTIGTQKAGVPDSPDNTDLPDTLDLEEEICEKLSNNGPMSRRELQRTFHKVSAATRDLALAKLLSSGAVQESEDRKLNVIVCTP